GQDVHAGRADGGLEHVVHLRPGVLLSGPLHCPAAAPSASRESVSLSGRSTRLSSTPLADKTVEAGSSRRPRGPEGPASMRIHSTCNECYGSNMAAHTTGTRLEERWREILAVHAR